MKKFPLIPPVADSKVFKTWWLCEVDTDGRRWPPLAWDWAPGSQRWYPHGTALGYNSKSVGRTPQQMSTYIVIAEAIVPQWIDAIDIGNRL